MIQRIQSVWLLLASICAFLTFKMPYYVGSIGDAPYQELNATTGGNAILIITALVSMLALLILFLYKQRVLQLRLCIVGILLEAILIFLYYSKTKTFTQGSYSLTCMLHSAIILFFVLAGQAINKDQNLVKDSNRLR
jgi:dipeptide/tripeptide permease